MSDFLGSLLNPKDNPEEGGIDFLGGLATSTNPAPKGSITSNRLSASVDQYQAGLLGFGEALAGAAGAENVQESLKQRREQNEFEAAEALSRARAQGAIESYKDVTGVGSALNYVGGLAAQSAPYLAESLVGGIGARALMGGTKAALRAGVAAGDIAAQSAARSTLAAGSLLGATAASYPSSVGDVLGNQREQTGETDLKSALALGVPYAALNAFGLEGALAKRQGFRVATDLLDSVSGAKGSLTRAAVTGVGVGAQEAFSETAQEALNQAGRMVVDPNEKFLNERSKEAFLESAVGGFALGGLGGAAGGGWRRSEGSFLPGSTTGGETDVSNKPDNNAINKAIDEEGTPLPSTSTQVDQVRQQQEVQLEQARVQAQQQVQQESVQVAQQQAQVQQQQAQEAFTQVAQTYGLKPGNQAGQFNVAGKILFTQNDAVNFLKSLDELNAGKSEEQKGIIGATLASGAVKVNADANPKTINNAVNKFLTGFGLDSAVNKTEAAERANTIISTMEGGTTLKKAEPLNNFYRSVTGQDAPAFTFLLQQTEAKPTKGASNEQLQNNARVREVPEQGGTTQASGTGTGDVRPASVQPVGTAGIGAGSLGLQTGAVPSQGVSTGAGASGSGISVSSTGTQAQGQVNEQTTPTPNQDGEAGQLVAGTRSNAAKLGSGELYAGASPELRAAAETAPNLWLKFSTSGSFFEELAPALQEAWLNAVVSGKVSHDLAAEIDRQNKPEDVTFRYVVSDLITRVIRPYGKLTDVVPEGGGLSPVAKKRQFIEKYFATPPANREEGNKDIQKIYGITKDQAIAWTRDAQNFMTKYAKSIAVNLEAMAKEYNFESADVLKQRMAESIAYNKDLSASSLIAADQVGQEFADQKIELANQTEEGTDQAGATVTNRVTGASVNEQFNEGDSITRKYEILMDRMDAAESALTAAETEENQEAIEVAKAELELAQMALVKLTEQAKKVNKKAAATSYSREEKTSAVQKPSTEGVSVRKQSEAGKRVPSKNAKERKAATESKQANEESRALTLEEQAAQAWDKGVKTYPEAPKFADLSEEQQKDWVGYGKENWTSEDVQTELVKLAKTPKLLSKSAQSFFFDEIESEPGLDRIRNYLEITGIPNALDFVSDWATINDPKAEAGSTESFGGRYKITVNMGLGNEAYIGETARHEIAHAVDMAPHGGVYSAQPEMAVVLKDGVITPLGKVARELYNLYQNSSRWNEYLAYPFDSAKFKDLDNSVKIELEIFAQAFAVYTDPNAKRLLEREAPITAAYFAEVINDIKSTKALQIQKAATAAERLTRFKNRNASERSEANFRIVQGREEAAGPKQLSLSAVSKTVDDIREKAKSNIDKIPASIRGPFRAIHDALFNAKETALSVMLTIDVVNMASKWMSSAKDWYEVDNRRIAIANDITDKLDKILVKAQEDLTSADRKVVNRLIEDSTIEDKWAFDPGIDGVTDKDIDPDLAKRFNAIGNPAAKQVIRDVFKFWHETLQQEQEAIRSEIDATFAERLANATETEKKAIEARKKDTLDKFSSILKAKATSPYAPLKRFGPFVVVAKSQEYIDAEKNLDSKWIKDNQDNEKHYVVEFAETASEAEAMYDELNKLGYDFVEKPFKRSESKDALYSSIDLYKAFTQLKKTISAEKIAATGEEAIEVYNKMNELVDELYLTSLSESSARKSELQRRKVAGFNRATSTEEARDMLRATFTQGASKAKHIAALKTNDASLKAMIAMQKQAQEHRAEAYPYLNELIAREAQALQVRERSMLDGVNRMTGDWFLTFSPGFYFQQAAQTYVLSVPWLAGKANGNYGKAFGAVTAAYKDIMPLVKGTKLREHLDFNNAPKDVREMLKNLVARGAINIGIESELLSHRSIDENIVTSTYNKVTNKLRGGINRIEALNRATAATAAYRLEMAKSGDKAKAEQAAFDVVKETHGLYDGSNTPRLFNKNAFTRSIFQFRRFQIIQLTTLARILKDAVAGGSATEKEIARRQFLFMTGHSLALAGVKGLPLYGLASFAYTLAKAAFGDEDDPKDFEAWLRTHGGLLLARGIPAFMGVDVSGKLGQGNVTSVLPYTDIDLTSRGGVEKLVIGAAGPFMGGLMPKMADGVGLMLGGQYYKGLEQVLPNGFGGVMKGARFATEGVTTRRGDLVMSPDEISFADGMMQALGLPTSKLSERQYLQGQLIKTDQFYNDRATEIKGSYTRAVKEGDTEARKEAQDAWKSLQNSRKENGYTVQPLSTLLKAPQEQKKRERSTVGGVAVTKSNKGFAQRTSEQ